jgi:hypothetical protein
MNSYNPDVLQVDNIYTIYFMMKPNYNKDYNDEIQKVKNGHTMFSDVISQIDNIQENINKSVMSKYKN